VVVAMFGVTDLTSWSRLYAYESLTSQRGVRLALLDQEGDTSWMTAHASITFARPTPAGRALF